MRIFFNRQQSVLSFVTTLLLAGLLWAPQALAGTCGVLPFGVSGDVGRGAGDNITSLVRTEVDIRGGFELVLTADEGEYKSSCGGDASCAKGFGRSAGHEQVIGGDVKAVGSEEYSVTAHLYEVRTGRRIRSVEQTVSRKADVLIDTIPNLVIELLTGEKPEVEEDVEEAERTRTARFDADFDEEDEDDSDLEEDDASAEAAPSWMERDRRGRKIRKDEDGGEELDDPFDDLDELDDLDLDDITEGRQRQRARARQEQEAREEAARQEEERLARLAEEEERQRREEQRRIEREREEREARMAEEADRRRREEERLRREREEEDRRQAERDQREREERERLRREREEEERRQAELRREREREERREADLRRDREEEERRRADLEREREREREREEDDRRRRAELERVEREQAEADRRARDDRRRSDSRSSSRADDYRRADDEEEDDMLLPEDLDDEESGLSLASGLILVEDEDEVGFLIEDDEEEEEEDDYRPRPGEILGENDSRDDPGVARRSAAAERDRDDRSRYSRARSFGDRDDDYGYQRNDDDRRLASNEDYNLDNDSYGGGGRSDSIRARPTDGSGSRSDRGSYGGRDSYGDRGDYDERSESSYGRRDYRTRSTSKTKRRDGPIVNIKAGAGWALYYPETLALGMFEYGFDVSVFALKWLTIDVAANFWAVSLVEYDDDDNATRTVRTLPNFSVGATWHGNFHRVIRPYAGLDIGMLLYAQALVTIGSNTQVRPLFAPVVAVDFGTDIIVHRNVGLFVGAKVGITHADRVQETVNVNWNPTTGLFNIRAGALVQF